ncbi:hypothetical protein E2320_019000, partial [Naja naja]
MTDCTPEMEGRSKYGRKERSCPSVVGATAKITMELETMSRYTSLVNRLCFHISLLVLVYGEVTSTKYTWDIYKELLISLVASLFMGFGVLFLLLWDGIY